MIPMFKRPDMDETGYQPMQGGDAMDAQAAAIERMRERYAGEPSARAASQVSTPVQLSALQRRRQGQPAGGLAALLAAMGGGGAGGRVMPSPGAGSGPR